MPNSAASPSIRRQLSVLLVDDDPGDVMMVEEALEASEIVSSVSVAGDGREAMEYLRRTGRFTDADRPDVMLLDLNMPRMSGHEVLTQVKADPELRTIPIVILTTSQAPADIRTSYELYANAYVRKPIDLDDLTDAVARINDFFGRIVLLAD